MSREKYNVKRHNVIQPRDPSIRLIALTQNQNAIVDTNDYEWLMKYTWHARWSPNSQGFYAQNSKHGEMHRMILSCKGKFEGDHKNHNTLDNRRINLRQSTRGQNSHNQKKSAANTSGYKEVHFQKRARKWQASLRIGQERKYLGLFKTPKQAALAYDVAARKFHGEFAFTNFRRPQ